MAWMGRLLQPAVCALAVLGNAGCGQPPPAPAEVANTPALPEAEPSVPTPLTVLRYGLARLPPGLDPHIYPYAQPGILLNNVYETLVYLTGDGRLEPSLAASWRVSADGLRYTFTLKRGVEFHDGTRFTAWAVKENLDRIADPSTGSSTASSLLQGYQGAVVMDQYTVQVRLDRPYPAFLKALTQIYLGMASPTAFRKWGRDEYQRHLAGTGPFRFVAEQYVPGKTIVLEKNQHYNWGPVSYRPNPPLYFGSGHDLNSSCQKTHLIHDHTGPAYLDRVIFMSIPDPSARARSLETGVVDAVDELSPAVATRLKKEGNYWITADGATFHGAHRTVNCLTYDARGQSPYLYDTAFFFRWAGSSPR